MDYQHKRDLVKNSRGATLENIPCSICGWANDYATIAPQCGGFWHATWETVERVIAGDGKFTARDVTFASWLWQGMDAEIPESLLIRAGR